MKQRTIQQRYQTSTKYSGIRKDLLKGTFLVEISVNGKRHSKSFRTFKEAIDWREKLESKRTDPLTRPSGACMTFGQLWHRYKLEYLPTLEISSQQTRLALEPFFSELLENEVQSITPNVISIHLSRKKQIALTIGSSRRQNFHSEIKLLRAIFNWYIQEVDHVFVCPVLKKHKKEAIIRVLPPKSKKLGFDELKAFFSEMSKDEYWYNFALLQFLSACRVSEIAGLQKKNVCFKTKRIFIQNVVIWSRTNKKFLQLKAYTKNTETKTVHMTPTLEVVLKSQLSQANQSDFVFTKNNNPLDYREIQYHYDKALKRAGLADKFSGTHLLRHSMATLTRNVVGTIDAVQAVTGHKDWKLAQHYGALGEDQNKKALNAVETELIQRGFFNNQCEQTTSSYEQNRKMDCTIENLNPSGTP